MTIRFVFIFTVLALGLAGLPARGELALLASFDNNGAGAEPPIPWRGESLKVGYTRWMELNTLAFSASAAVISDPNQPFVLAPATMSEFSLVKPIDTTTPQVLKALAAGTILGKVEILLVDFSFQGVRPIVRYVLGQVVVLRQEQGTQTGDEAATEAVALDYRTLEVKIFGFNLTTGQLDPTRDIIRFYDQTNP